MSESTLHAALKKYYAGQEGELEVAIDGFLIDVVRNNKLIEIQTNNFSSLKHKLASILPNHKVKVVFPIPTQKRIIRYPNDNTGPLSRRKSPKKGRIEYIFNELLYIAPLIPHPNLSFEVVFTIEEEIRRDDGKGSWRRKGVSIIDRRLIQLLSFKEILFPQDYKSLIPFSESIVFSNKDLSNALGIPIRLSRKMTYSLKIMGIIENYGKTGNSLLFRRCQ